MLSDKQLNQAASQLAQFRLKQDEHYKNHGEILDKYAAIIADYERLQSELEEARDSRTATNRCLEAWSETLLCVQQSPGFSRRRWLCISDFVKNREAGGSEASQRLKDAVQQSLSDRPGLENCTIIVPVYANVAGLSKALAFGGMLGHDKRSLAPFIASFNRSNDLFDFVDAGDLKENADSKIRGQFRQFIDSPQCRHIYFAACHDVGYINELAPFAGQRDRITLVRNYAMHAEFAKLKLRVEELPGVFRTTEIPSATSGGGVSVAGSWAALATKPNGTNASATRSTASPSPTPSTPINATGTAIPIRTKVDELKSSAPTYDLRLLPKEDKIPRGKIPVNIHDQRLDSYIPPASHDDNALFKARISKQKLCNNYHVGGYCPNGNSCQYDHKPVPKNIMNVLKSVARGNACPQGDMCRSMRCIYGHICQWQGCSYHGGKQFCKRPEYMHEIDTRCAEFVPSNEEMLEETIRLVMASHASFRLVQLISLGLHGPALFARIRGGAFHQSWS